MSFNFDLLEQISEGFGIPKARVFKAKNSNGVKKISRKKQEPQEEEEEGEVILKVYDMDDLECSYNFEDTVKIIMNEVMTMKQFRQENLMQCIDSFVKNSQITLVLPRMNIGSVRDLLDLYFPEGLPELAVTFILKDVLIALQYLHSKSIVHRSVKASHILLTERGPAKLTGFRYCCSLMGPEGVEKRHDYPTFVAKTNLNYMSPEYLQQDLVGYNEKTDIYSLGVTACESANGIIPFSELEPTAMFLEKLKGASPKLFDTTTYEEMPHPAPEQLQPEPADHPGDSGVGASVGSSTNVFNANRSKGLYEDSNTLYNKRTFTRHFHEFVDLCCVWNSNDRPGAGQLLVHPFIKQLKKNVMSMASIMASVKSIDQPAPGQSQDPQPQQIEDRVSVSSQLDQMSLSELHWLF